MVCTVGVVRNGAMEPVWEYWDAATGAQAFRDKEITLHRPIKPDAMTTSYRTDYPPHKPWWQHKERPDHNSRPIAPFDHTSTYREFYTAQKVGGTASCRPDAPKRAYEPKLDTLTTSRASFLVPNLPPPAVHHKDGGFRPNLAPIGNSTNRDDYVQHPLPSRYVRPMPTSDRAPTKFDGTTTTRSDYPRPGSLPPPRASHTNPTWYPSPFDGTSEYRDKYEEIKLPSGMPGAIGLQVRHMRGSCMQRANVERRRGRGAKGRS